ncbi:MAG: polysaccharide biosynthesis C-terminal domain-containing protein [Clostridia bacterium]|nr:polysaccharide biosynthesis C-terminal domain-containing protein [Clostridia bacterium]
MNRKIGVILSYVMMIFEILSTLLLTPYILSSLGQAEFGVYKLSSSITSYLLLLDLGVSNAVVRYVAKFRANNQLEENQKFLGVAIIYYLIIALITLILGVVLYFLFPTIFAVGLNQEEIKLGQQLLIITIINAAITLGTSAFQPVITAHEEFAFQKGWSIFQITLKIIFTYVALELGMQSLGIVIVHLILTVVTRGIFALYVFFKIKLRPKFKNINFGFIKEVFAYTSLVLLQMIATQINSMVGQILLGILVPTATVIIAIYGIGTQVVQYFQNIGSAFNGILMPGVVKMVESDATPSRIQNEMVRIGRIKLIILSIILVGFIIYGKQFINLWAGNESEPAYYVAIILMLGYLFTNVNSVGNQILWAKNEHKEQAIIKLAIVLLNILLTVFLIKWNALLGVTIGTFIALILGDVVLINVVIKKKLGISLVGYYLGLFKGILPSLLITGAVGYLFSLLSLGGWLGFICNVAVMVIVYLICLLLFGFNNYEKKLLSSIFLKIFKKQKEKNNESI